VRYAPPQRWPLPEHDDMLPSSSSTSERPFPPESIRNQLARILRSEAFSNAPSLVKFLRHVVEHTIEGNTEELKEYSLGVEVFGRGEAFDPRTDTIVRVQARRLRSKLKGYYDAEGQTDPIVIELPKGHYGVTFRSHFPREHGSTLHLVPNIEGFRGRNDGGHSEAPGSRLPSLPALRTPLIGREQELAALKRLLIDGSPRLITLTGAGGSGKTRLGLQAASEVIAEFPGGIYFVALASITDPTTVTSTVAQVLGVRHTGGKPLVEALREHLRLLVYAPTLLFLDNFEHLLAAAALVGELLEACAPLKVLVTSRAVLHVYGEYEYLVPPLALPAPEQFSSLEVLAGNPAVTLFVERAAAAVRGEFVLTKENAPVVAQICCRVDGLPLAIELAAARIRMLAPVQVLVRLESRLDVLTCGAVDVPRRQQTLRRTIDWSHDLLSPEEQKLFRRLSVFVGGCTLEAAEAVCNTRRDLGIEVFDGISLLLDKSLMQQIEQRDGEARFAMLETIREYGLEQLTATGEEEATRRSHAAYCLVVAEDGNLPLTLPERTSWLELCDAEHDNLRSALDWLIARDNSQWALRLALALYEFWEPREHFVEGRDRLEAILRMNGAQARTRARAKAAGHAGGLASVQGDYERAFCMHREALDIYCELGDQRGIGKQFSSLGFNHDLQGNYAAARSEFEQSLRVCRELGDARETAGALSNMADVVNAQGDHTQARALLEEAMSILRKLEDWIGVAWSLNHLGDVARDRGDFAEARRLYQEGANSFRRLGEGWGMARSATDLGYLACDQNDPVTGHSLFEEALVIFLELGHKRGTAKVLEGFAHLAVHENNPKRALKLVGAASALRQTIGAPCRPREQAKLDATLKPAWQGDSAAAKAAWVAGWRMQLEEAIQYALDRAPSKSARSTQN
jgi:predicted ATPase